MRAVAFLVAWVACCGPAAAAAELEVQVTGIHGTAGSLRIAVCTEAEYPKQACRYRVRAPVHDGAETVIVPGIADGRYAVLVHHDRNDDGVVDTDWIGIPVEGVGVSRNATGFMGRPHFADVAIDIAGGRTTVAVTLRQEPER